MAKEISPCSVAELKRAIQEFLDNANPKPFVSTKTADEILASIARFAQRTTEPNSGTHDTNFCFRKLGDARLMIWRRSGEVGQKETVAIQRFMCGPEPLF